MGQSYAGPVLIATREEAGDVLMLMRAYATPGRPVPDTFAGLKAKCERVLASDPKWREPTK